MIRDEPPDRPRAVPGEAHVWRADLDAPPGLLVEALRGDERERAARFIDGRDRTRWVASRAALRDILGRYLDLEPGEVRLDAGFHGKPELARGADGRPHPVRFNLSHAGPTALYAVAAGREVGVDVERLREDVEVEQLAGRFFAPIEAEAVLAAGGPRERRAAFFTLWTGKEALLKATGLGLSGIGEARLPVEVWGDRAARPVEVLLAAPGRPPSSWSVLPLDAGTGLAAALALEGPPGTVRTWRWSPRS